MRFLVLSDIHDHVFNLQAVLATPEARACDTLICCGDLCAPFVIDELDAGFNGPVHIVFGNNDGDQFLITSKACRINANHSVEGRPAKIYLHGQYLLSGEANQALFGALPGRGTSAGRPAESPVRIAVCHYPQPARQLAASGSYHMVFYGHDHVAACLWMAWQGSAENAGSSHGTWLLNPGAVMGWRPGVPAKSVPVSFAVVDCSMDVPRQPGRGGIRFYAMEGVAAQPWSLE